MTTLQTLDRGVRALFVVAAKTDGLTVTELAAELGVARPICYRLVATLEHHGLVTRGTTGRVHLGAGVAALAASYWPSLLSKATPVLQDLANRTSATAFLSVAEGAEAVALLSLDPSSSSGLRVGYRVGSRHPIDRAAAGIAILAGRPPSPEDPSAVVHARARGYSITRDQLQPGAVGVAAPLGLSRLPSGGPEAAVGLVALDDFDAEAASAAVVEAARAISGEAP